MNKTNKNFLPKKESIKFKVIQKSKPTISKINEKIENLNFDETEEIHIKHKSPYMYNRQKIPKIEKNIKLTNKQDTHIDKPHNQNITKETKINENIDQAKQNTELEKELKILKNVKCIYARN
jgi:hypothetical protein